MADRKLTLGEHITLKRSLGAWPKDSQGTVLDVDSKGNITIKMHGELSQGKEEYIVVVQGTDMFERHV